MCLDTKIRNKNDYFAISRYNYLYYENKNI